MEDKQIIELYWARSEQAIPETAKKYGALCRHVANRILCDTRDSEECVNDTYLHTWYSIPPKRPDMLSAFLGKVTRLLALKRYEQNTAQKRGGGQCALVLDELDGCTRGDRTPASPEELIVLRDTMELFLSQLDDQRRDIFMRRYWLLCPIREIAQAYNMSEGKVKMILLRTRNELKQLLEQEGICI